jgi:hypothetical protein
MGHSNFNHVPLYSPTVPRLVRMHRKTIAMHSHCKTGDVVWWSGMWGIGILMHHEFLFCIMTGIIYISPISEMNNPIQKFNGVLMIILVVAEKHTILHLER